MYGALLRCAFLAGTFMAMNDIKININIDIRFRLANIKSVRWFVSPAH